MVDLIAIDIVYLMLLIGSLAFGLEALLLGMGGKLMLLYRKRRAMTIALALAVGLAIVAPAVVTSAALSLEPVYICAVVVTYMLAAAGIARVFGGRLVRGRPSPLPPRASDEEIESMLKKRGLGKLVKKKRSR